MLTGGVIRLWFGVMSTYRQQATKTGKCQEENSLDIFTKCKYIFLMNVTHSTPFGDFEWDSAKDTANRKKHGISFALAIEAFADNRGVYRLDAKHSLGEERLQLIGQVGGDILLLVVFTERNAVRIISARKATRQEKKFYADANR